jgi:phage baseplate assembly protein W
MPTIQGLAYPLALDNGGLKVAADADLIRCHIYSVLETYRLERILQPTFGLPQLVFQSVPAPSVITERIRRALTTQIPNTSFSLRTVIDDSGTLTVSIAWKLNSIPQPAIQYRLTL